MPNDPISTPTSRASASIRRRANGIGALASIQVRNTTDNVLNAHHGTQITLHAEEAGRLLPGTHNHYAPSADGQLLSACRTPAVMASRAAGWRHQRLWQQSPQVPFLEEIPGAHRALSVDGDDTKSVRSVALGSPLGGNGSASGQLEARARACCMAAVLPLTVAT